MLENAGNFAQIDASEAGCRTAGWKPAATMPARSGEGSDNEIPAELTANRQHLTASCPGFGCGSATLDSEPATASNFRRKTMHEKTRNTLPTKVESHRKTL